VDGEGRQGASLIEDAFPVVRMRGSEILESADPSE
jgi:hypothetical protein